MEFLVRRDVLLLSMRLNFVTNPHARFIPPGSDQSAAPPVVEDLRHSQEVVKIYPKVLKTFAPRKLYVWYHVTNKIVRHGRIGLSMVLVALHVVPERNYELENAKMVIRVKEVAM